MTKTLFHISKMDCPSEEQLIRMKLENHPEISSLIFDIPQRNLTVFHKGLPETIKSALDELQMGTSILSSEETSEIGPVQKDTRERKILWAVLAINFGFFILEMLTGILSRSMGLVADSLDMLADALVYGLSLYAVGAVVARKKSVARWSGYLQMFLAIAGFAEVIRRFMGMDSPPDFLTMIIISALALAGNALCLYLLQKAKSDDAHMKASMIFTSNDIIVNIGVIAAGILVYLTSSNKPDLIIGSIVFLIVMRGAIRILRLAK